MARDQTKLFFWLESLLLDPAATPVTPPSLKKTLRKVGPTGYFDENLKKHVRCQPLDSPILPTREFCQNPRLSDILTLLSLFTCIIATTVAIPGKEETSGTLPPLRGCQNFYSPAANPQRNIHYFFSFSVW